MYLSCIFFSQIFDVLLWHKIYKLPYEIIHFVLHLKLQQTWTSYIQFKVKHIFLKFKRNSFIWKRGLDLVLYKRNLSVPVWLVILLRIDPYTRNGIVLNHHISRELVFFSFTVFVYLIFTMCECGVQGDQMTFQHWIRIICLWKSYISAL